ncbi:hypothetical protein [Scrofimicrobium canadense]
MLASRGQGEDLLEAELLAELDTTDLRLEADQLSTQAATVADAIEKLIATNARVPQNQADYQQRFDKLSAEHMTLLEQHETLLAEITDRQNRVAAYQHYKTSVAELDRDQIKFTPYLWHTLTDHAEVGAEGTITIILRNGTRKSIQRPSSK